eukprot:scaffold105581_cov22-Phaeocystis_antarctica.AAC.1
MSRSTSCSHVPPSSCVLQTRPRAEKVAGGTSLGCFIGWRRCSREVLTCSGMTGERAREEPMTVDHPARAARGAWRLCSPPWAHLDEVTYVA